MYTQLGVITKGTIIEVTMMKIIYDDIVIQVNVSELGLVTQSGKVAWGKSYCTQHCNSFITLQVNMLRSQITQRMTDVSMLSC